GAESIARPGGAVPPPRIFSVSSVLLIVRAPDGGADGEIYLPAEHSELSPPTGDDPGPAPARDIAEIAGIRRGEVKRAHRSGEIFLEPSELAFGRAGRSADSETPMSMLRGVGVI